MKERALDSETFLMFPGYLAPKLVCVSWAQEKKSGLFHHTESREFVKECLDRDTLVFANAPYDLGVFGSEWPETLFSIFNAFEEGRIHDVLMREKLLDLARGTFRFEEDEDGNFKIKGYNLAGVSKRRLGRFLQKEDTWRLRYHDLVHIPLQDWPEEARKYAVDDAKTTLDIYNNQDKLKKYLGNELAQVKAHWALHLTSCWGFRTDGESLDVLEMWVREEIRKIKDILVDAELVRKDGTRDTKAACRRMLEVMGDKAILTTKGVEMLEQIGAKALLQKAREEGKYISVSEESTMISMDETLQAYSAYTRYRNLLTGAITQLRHGTKIPIQTRFEALMETGRTSSSSPNIQNMRRAKGIRECFRAREGKVILAGDYAAAELHTFAQCCYDWFGYSKMGDAMNEGIDVHLWVAARLSAIPYDEALGLYTSGDETIAEVRQLAKAANFGFPGGCSAARFAILAQGYGLRIDVRTAAKLKALWLGTWDEANDYFTFIRQHADKDGYYWLKQNRVERIRGRMTYTAACNTPFQGLASDGAKAAMYRMQREQMVEPESALFGTATLNFVHDEILAEVPRERVTECAHRLKLVMEEEFNQFVPNCPTTVDVAAMFRWSKKAKSIWKDGELIPFEEAA